MGNDLVLRRRHQRALVACLPSTVFTQYTLAGLETRCMYLRNDCSVVVPTLSFPWLQGQKDGRQEEDPLSRLEYIFTPNVGRVTSVWMLL